MHAPKLLHNVLKKALPFMHQTRLAALMHAVDALLIGKQLSLTLLGRHLPTKTKERHCIRKMDRLLGNTHLHQEITPIYQTLNRILTHHIRRPIISIDWSCVNKKKDWHILRATLNLKGRGLVVYQEVHPKDHENSPKVQAHFLKQLKTVLPKHAHPIIVTDAGFRCPWFRQASSLGFDYVGRLRNKTSCRPVHQSRWLNNVLDFYTKASAKATYLGRFILAKKVALECHLVLVKKSKRHRTHLNRSGKPTNNTASNRCARRYRDPWLLVTSLDVTSMGPKRIEALYALRMQIEEDFRDIKSHQFGFSLRYCQSKHAQRIAVLLLIAALAALVCWLVAIAAQQQNLHRDYQANTIQHRRVLSVIYLACQLFRRHVSFKKNVLNNALKQFLDFIQETHLCIIS